MIQIQIRIQIQIQIRIRIRIRIRMTLVPTPSDVVKCEKVIVLYRKSYCKLISEIDFSNDKFGLCRPSRVSFARHILERHYPYSNPKISFYSTREPKPHASAASIPQSKSYHSNLFSPGTTESKPRLRSGSFVIYFLNQQSH